MIIIASDEKIIPTIIKKDLHKNEKNFIKDVDSDEITLIKKGMYNAVNSSIGQLFSDFSQYWKTNKRKLLLLKSEE